MADAVYAVTGMSCEHCVHAVQEAATGVDGVEAAEVDLAGSTVTVHGAGWDPEALRLAVDDAGYELTVP